MRSVFFYGLFMDPEVRFPVSGERRPGVLAYLEDYACAIGTRSTLTPNRGSRVYGTVVELSEEECARLYPAPTYSAYQPTAVSCATTTSGERVAATAYIAPTDAIGAFDRAYVDQLVALCRRLGFPNDYIERLR